MGDGKRRDAKGRVLWTGETQEPTGLYVYRYQDLSGKRKKLTSWRLTAADAIPKGKKDKEPLREQEKNVQKMLDKGLNTDKITVGELVDRYLSLKGSCAYSTLQLYRAEQKTINRTALSKRNVSEVRYSDAKLFCKELSRQGVAYPTLVVIHRVLRPAFQMAVEDRIIEYNPFSFRLSSVVTPTKQLRKALTKKQKQDFLEFVRQDKTYSKYWDAIFILFSTGLRISEFCGLTEDDIDFEEHALTVNKQLLYQGGKYVVNHTKTEAGVRKIPIGPDTEEAFHRMITRRGQVFPEVDGIKGFLVLSREGRPMYQNLWSCVFMHICDKYHSETGERLNVTPHVCRHTFCSEMANAGMNVKALQYLMGHSSSDVTMDVYTHVSFEDVQAAVAEVQSRDLGQSLGQTQENV